MSGYNGEAISSVPISVHGQQAGDGQLDSDTTNSEIQSKFRQFIRVHVDENNQFIYRDQLQSNYMQGKHVLEMRPAEHIPLFENAVKEVIINITVPKPNENDVVPFQVVIKNFPKYTNIRHLSSENISKLVCVRGIVTGAAKPRIKAIDLCIMCRNCKSVKHVRSGTGFGSAQLPRQCDNANQAGQNDGVKCPMDPYVILADNSQYINVQTLKLQESPESVPTGEMPRNLTLACDKYLVGNVKPGTRITVVGVYSTFTAKQMGNVDKSGRTVSDIGIRLPYVRVLGIEQDSEANDILMGKLSAEDEEDIHELVASHPDIYTAIAKSIAPAIMGRDDIKKAIACALFGGCRKFLPDGMRLRGDINILLLGDPSVAKSQFLKFASQVAPISVYTSGKGSSAAGLTASVIRSPGSGEFHLEGGALVLADGGLVCIDEFDKMREQDRVAIHEAMEQQTISIAKAGITTILNSRTSVLAAANPVFGRYDDMKSATDNIDFQATILSRFDLIFIIRDLQDTALDTALARHIINVHQKVDNAINTLQEGIIEIDKMKKLIAYARRLQPRLSEEAAEHLKNRYVAFRDKMLQDKKSNSGDASHVIPITVRQLEAIVRISESLARMSLTNIATEDHVKEALRLFKVATLQAASNPLGEATAPQHVARINECQAWIKNIVPFQTEISTRDLVRKAHKQAFDENISRRAIYELVQKEGFAYRHGRKLLYHGARAIN